MTADSAKKYDLIVIGSGPGGQRAAIQAAKLGKCALVIEKQKLGGACLHLGTIPSKALREAALSFISSETAATGSALRAVMVRTHRVIDEEKRIIAEQLSRNRIEFVTGVGSFVDAKTVEVTTDTGSFLVKADMIVIATGTRPRRPADLPFDNETLFDSDTILSLKSPPRTLLVLGAGVIGCEYASILAKAGVEVTLSDARPTLLPSIDQEIVASLLKQFEIAGLKLKLGAKFSRFEAITDSTGRKRAKVEMIEMNQPKSYEFDAVLYCLGRTGNYEELNLQAVGLRADDRGTLSVDTHYQTTVPGIYAVGDIIGAPALAASSSEQGRLAVLHAVTGSSPEFPDTFPYGIYTIPEISSVGVQESQLAKRGIRYVVGKAYYRELARGKMIGDEHGFLKLVVHARTRRVVGIHVIGTSATELVHIGQVAMAFGATVDFFVENVFNYPTLAEAYKVAAYSAFNKLNQA